MIKRIFFILILLLSLNVVFSKEKNLSVLVVPFYNASFSEEEDYIIYILYDSALNFLKGEEHFDVQDSFNKVELNFLKEDEIIKRARINNTSFLITGFFIKIDSEIKVTVKIIEVKREKVLFLDEFINKDEKSLQGDLLNSLRKGIKYILDTDLSEHNIKKRKGENFILNVVNDEFLFFEIGFSSSIFSTILLQKDVTDDYDISSVENNYLINFVFYYNLEYYKSYKNNFYGIGISLSFPFNIEQPKFYNYYFLELSFLFSYKKIFFFKWALTLSGYVFNIYSMRINNYKDNFSIRSLNWGMDFNFRYLSNKYNFYIGTGFLLVPPLFLKFNDSVDFLFNEISVSNDINNNSLLIPVLLNFEIAKFINKEVGFFIKTVLSFYYIDYHSRFFWFHNMNVRYEYEWNFGETFSININIIAGFTFKTIFF